MGNDEQLFGAPANGAGDQESNQGARQMLSMRLLPNYQQTLKARKTTGFNNILRSAENSMHGPGAAANGFLGEEMSKSAKLSEYSDSDDDSSSGPKLFAARKKDKAL